MSLSQQETLLDTDLSGAVALETNGRIIRPFLDVVWKLVDECKIRADEDGLTIRAVDPPNVGMVGIEAPASAFDSYEIEGGDEVVIGTNLSKLRSVLSDARMRQHDPDDVQLRLGTSVISAEIEREYVDTVVHRTDEFLAIDADSIRPEPDITDLDFEWRADMDSRALSDTVAHLDSLYNHVQVRASDEGVYLGAVGDKDGDNNIVEAASATIDAQMEAVEDDPQPIESLFSLDYVSDVVAGVKASKADRVTLGLADQFPMKAFFERRDDDGDLVYEGEYAVAPRVKKDE